MLRTITVTSVKRYDLEKVSRERSINPFIYFVFFYRDIKDISWKEKVQLF